MKTKDKESKYVVLLKDKNKSTFKKAEKQLGLSLTSSAELSSKVRANHVLESGNGLYLKNLGLIILDNVESEKLSHAAKSRNSSILMWEEDRIFKTQTELDLIKQMRTDLSKFATSIDKLERLLQPREDVSEPTNWAWGLSKLGLDTSKLTGKGVDICILDTGFYLDHPDFKTRNIVGKSFVPGERWDLDPNGHGTHCTGVAAGDISLIDGLKYGIAKGANIAIGKVLANNGSGTTTAIMDSLDNCLQKKYKVVSLSLGSPVNIGQGPSDLFEHVGNRALKNNTLIIAAAGNDSNRPNTPKPVNSPANASSIMAVGALTKTMEVAKFSNAGINPRNGGKVDLAAPGVAIKSSFSLNNPKKKLYLSMNGTSMATPHVAGIAALYCEAYPRTSAKNIWLKMEKNAKLLTRQLSRDVGHGLVQV